MTHEEKIQYMQMACNICNFGVDYGATDLLVSLYEHILENKDEANLKGIAKIKAESKQRADAKSRSEMLDKVSEKVK